MQSIITTCRSLSSTYKEVLECSSNFSSSSQSSHPWILRPTASPSFLTCARTLQIPPLLSFQRVRPLRSLPPPFSSRCSLHSVRIFLAISSLVMLPPNPNPISLLDLASKALDYFPLPLRKQLFLFCFFSRVFLTGAIPTQATSTNFGTPSCRR